MIRWMIIEIVISSWNGWNSILYCTLQWCDVQINFYSMDKFLFWQSSKEI